MTAIVIIFILIIVLLLVLDIWANCKHVKNRSEEDKEDR